MKKINYRERDLLIYQGWLYHLSFVQLADSAGISSQRVRQIIVRYNRMLRHPNFTTKDYPSNPIYRGVLKHHHYNYFIRRFKVLSNYYDVPYVPRSPAGVMFEIKRYR